MPTHSVKARTLILCLVIAVVGASPLCAGGQKEVGLAQAEKLITQQDYSAAETLLVRLARENPELRDEIDRLLLQIKSRHDEYNTVLLSLNDAVFRDDLPTIERLKAELQKIDPKQAVAVGRNAEIRVAFLKLMDSAQNMIAGGRPADALSLYFLPLKNPSAAGFDMRASDFDSAGYSAIITASVHDSVARLVAAGDEALRAADSIAAAQSAVDALLAGRLGPDSPAAFDAIAAPLVIAALSEGSVRTIASSLADVNETIRTTSGTKKADPFLEYLAWLSLGREGEREGIARAVELLWEDRAAAIQSGAASKAAGAFTAALSRYEAGALAEAAAGFDTAYYESVIAVKAAALQAAAFDVRADRGWQFMPADAASIKGLLKGSASTQENASEVGAYKTLIQLRTDFSGLPAADPAAPVTASAVAAESAQLAQARAALDAVSTKAQEAQREWAARAGAWGPQIAAGIAGADVAASARAVSDRFAVFVTGDVQKRDLAYALRLATIGGIDFAPRLADAKALRSQGEDLKEGTQGGKMPADFVGIPEKHPELAVPVFASAAAALDSLVAGMRSFMQKLLADKPYVTSSAGLGALFNGSATRPGYSSIVRTAAEERAALDPLIAATQKQVDDAALASKEGDNWFTRAQQALKAKTPGDASDLLDRAVQAYFQSLALAYTDHANTRVNKDQDDFQVQLSALSQQIAIENAQKSYVAIGKKLQAGNYLGASDDLDAAEKVWHQSFEQPYAGFEAWRQQIQSALEVNQGRDIKPIDARAPVVNTLIKYARDNLAAGKLADAALNVKDALAVAPSYGTAKVLELQIEKQTDPASFQKKAAFQVAGYLDLAKDKSNTPGLRTAYLALVDYSALDPKIAQQTRAVRQELRYDLGMDPRPASAAELSRYRSLVVQANDLQGQGTQEGYSQALDLLSQALRINTDTTSALRLDGQIRARIGSTALTTLSATDGKRFNQAYNLYLSGGYVDGYTIILELLKTPRNGTYQPLKRLQKRFEQELNI